MTLKSTSNPHLSQERDFNERISYLFLMLYHPLKALLISRKANTFVPLIFVCHAAKSPFHDLCSHKDTHRDCVTHICAVCCPVAYSLTHLLIRSPQGCILICMVCIGICTIWYGWIPYPCPYALRQEST